jgi:DNA replication protein DnaC
MSEWQFKGPFPEESEESKRRRAETAIRAEQDRLLSNMRSAGVGDQGALRLFQTATAAELATTKAMREIQAEAKKGTIVLSGASGTGKSWASYFLIREQAGSLLISFCDVVPHNSWYDIRQEVIKAPLLVIDDFGMGPLTAWRDAEVESIVCRRHEAGRRTVCSTNLSPVDVVARFGDRFERRVGAMIVCE